MRSFRTRPEGTLCPDSNNSGCQSNMRRFDRKQACSAVEKTPTLNTAEDLRLRDLALDRIRQGLCVFDRQQRLLLFNRQYAEMYDLDAAHLWIGMTLRDVIDLRYAAGTGPGMSPIEYAAWRDRIGIAEQVVDSEVTLRDGRIHAIHHEPTPDGGWVATFDDITERRRAEAHVRHMAHHDALTELPNRVLFIERLGASLTRLRGQVPLEDHRAAPSAVAGLVAVLFLDLDNFKAVNDTLGHAAGDMLLRSMAERVLRCLRGGDTLARLGGDEFAILLDLDHASTERAQTIAQGIIDEGSAPYLLDEQVAVVGVSVGIAICTKADAEGLDVAKLLRRADVALYQAKTTGRRRFHLFSQALT